MRSNERETNHGDAFKAEVSGIPKVVGRLDFANDDHALDTYAPLTVGIVPWLCWEGKVKVLNNLRSRYSWVVPLPFDTVIPGFNAVLLYAGFVVSSRFGEVPRVPHRCVCQCPEDLFERGVSINILRISTRTFMYVQAVADTVTGAVPVLKPCYEANICHVKG